MSSKILVVENNKEMRDLLSSFINISGCKSLAVASAALASAILNRENINLILCDIGMPGVNGFEFFCEICQKWPHLKNRFVFISGGQLSWIEEQIREKRVPIYYKPVTLDTVKMIIKQYAKE